MDELTIMEVPEPPSMGTTGSLLMEQVAKVRQSVTRGYDWEDIALKGTSSKGGAFCTYDDANDPDVKSVAALFAAGEHEEWGGGNLDAPDAPAATAVATGGPPDTPSVTAVATVEAVRAAKAKSAAPSLERKWETAGGGGGSEDTGGNKEEAPASSVRT